MVKISLLKKIQFVYVIALSFIGLISTSFYFFMESQISKNFESGELINLSGKQRMLSQKTSLIAFSYLTFPNDEKKNEVLSLLEKMERAESKIDCGEGSRCSKELNFSIKEMMGSHLEKILQVLEQEDKNKLDEYILTELPIFLSRLDKRTNQLEASSKETIAGLISAERFILLLILIILFLEYKVIFKPGYQKLFLLIEKLNASNLKNEEIIKEKEKILMDLSHNLKTPISKLYQKIHLEEQLEPSFLQKFAGEMEKTINFLLNFHKEQECQVFRVSSVEKIFKDLVIEQITILDESNAKSLVKYDEKILQEMFESLYRIKEIHDLHVRVRFGEKVKISLSGEKELVSSIFSLFDENNPFPDIFYATFIRSINEYPERVIELKENSIKIQIGLTPSELRLNPKKIKKILVVDDNSINRKLISEILEKEGYDTRFAIDGIDCLKKLRIFTPDLIFMDVKMPRLDGNETIKKIKEMGNSNIHFVTVSANNSALDIAISVGAGCHSFLSKPFRKDEILEEMRFAKNYYLQKRISIIN